MAKARRKRTLLDSTSADDTDLAAADKARRKAASILDDYITFARVGEQVDMQGPVSLRDIGQWLDLEPAAIGAALDRCNTRAGLPLMTLADRTSSENRLTPAGEELLREFRRLVQWRPHGSRMIRLALAPTVLGIKAVTTALADFQENQHCQYELETDPGLDRAALIHRLQTLRLELALFWLAEGEKPVPLPGVEQMILGPAFDLVLITRRAEDAKLSSERLLQELPVSRIATPPAWCQPGLEQLPMPDGGNGGERLVVPSCEAVISCVHAGIARFGLIVAGHDALQPLVLTGQLHATAPVGQVRLLLMRGRRPSEIAYNLIAHLRKQLADTGDAEIPWTPPTCDSRFPSSHDFYTKLAHAYYIDVPRDNDREPHKRPEWHWEITLLNRVPPPERPSDMPEAFLGDVFTGRIRNCLGDSFQVHARRFGNRLFGLEARVPPGSIARASVNTFISIFHWCDPHPDEGWIYGQWIGQDPVGGHPTVFATVWSHKRLSFSQLRRITRQVRMRTLLDVDTGLDFESQPADNTSLKEPARKDETRSGHGTVVPVGKDSPRG